MSTASSGPRPTDGTATLAALKDATRETWALGDFAAVAERELWPVGERIVRRLDIRPDEQVLDVACGTGNAAIRAALAGGRTVGVDLTPKLLSIARDLAARAGATVEWREGDAEELPLDDGSVDVVVSTFGCEVAPRHHLVAREIARVLRSGGRMGLCVWPSDGTMASIMRTAARYLPPLPPGTDLPLRWGDPDHVRGLFTGTGIELEFERAVLEHEPFESAEADVDWHAARFGPLIRARQAAEATGRWNELRDALIPLHRDRTQLEYLMILGTKHEGARA
jgi:SAM-dependent methyltransferase